MAKDGPAKPGRASGALGDTIDLSVVAHIRHEYGAADASVLVELIQRVSDKGRTLQAVASDIEQNSFIALHSAAQQLRIVSGAVGAVELVQICADFERAARDSDLARVRELRRGLSWVIVRARSALLRLALSTRPDLPV